MKNNLTLKFKALALSTLTMTALCLSAIPAAAEGTEKNMCANDTKELIKRGVVFVVKTEVNVKKKYEDTFEQNKLEFENLLCLQNQVINYDQDINTVTPEIKSQMVLETQLLLKRQALSIKTDAHLAKRFSSDEAIVKHIVELIIEAPDAYLSFWYHEYIGTDDDSAVCEIDAKTIEQLNGIKFIQLPYTDAVRESLKAINNDSCLSVELTDATKELLVEDLLSEQNQNERAEDIIANFINSLP
jgi:hypothetical protein